MFTSGTQFSDEIPHALSSQESFEIYHKIDNFVINEDIFDRNFSGQNLDRELNILNENAHTVEDY
jgi:hypothetical protein